MPSHSQELLQAKEEQYLTVNQFPVGECHPVDVAVQQALIEDFKQQPVFEIIARMSSQERSKLFDINDGIGASSTDDESCYFQTNLWSRIRKRTVWLILLLVANTATTGVIRAQESVLQQMIVLAAFIPLLIGTAGNTSTQSATVVIRGLSQGSIKPKQALGKILEEAIAGILMGLILGTVATGIAFLLKGSVAVAIVVGVSLMIASALATVSGATLPFLFQTLGFDPALMSAPISSVIVDVMGVLIYLNVARLFLNLW